MSNAPMNAANARAQGVIDTLLPRRDPLAVLEAGCGSVSHLRIVPGARMTGIDISENQLARNAHLDVKICGDLQTHELPSREFDMVVCWDVLEHLDQPRAALARMFSSVAPGGVVVLALPNLYSIKGLVTKFTPYAFHVWFYRYVMGDRSPRDEFGQFPTYLRMAVSARNLVAMARANGFTVAHFDLYEGPVQEDLRKRNRVADAAFGIAGAACRMLSLGRYDPNRTDMIVVLQAP
jgi:SAM-dependent methyltransferase